MKLLLLSLLLVPAQASAAPFALESLRAADLRLAAPLTPPAPARLAAEQGPSAEWILAVKREYLSNPVGTMPPAELSELPPEAVKQMEWDAAVYPSRAYKMTLAGRTAYIIENDNLDALYVNIFDQTGAHIAYGGYDENYDFYWLTKKR